jgi:large subunit ribosomal protein L10
MREEKKLLLEEIKEKVKLSKALIVTRYENINTEEMWVFRNTLSKNASELEVVKKRILLKVLEQCGYSYKSKDLNGHIAVVFVKPEGDAVNATKVVFEFSNETNKMQILRGEIEGISYNKDDLVTLSTLPSINELRAQFLGLLEAPMSQTVTVMQSVLTSVMYALEEKKKLEEKK